MSDETVPVDSPSDYAVFEFERGKYAIIKKKYNYNRSESTYEYLVPNAGQTAFKLLRWFRSMEVKERQAAIDRELDWQERLTKPHPFIKESTRSLNCHCGKLESDVIHTDPDIEADV